MDYIYQGEIQIYQEHLNSFLEVAQKLKVEGLVNDATNLTGQSDYKAEEYDDTFEEIELKNTKTTELKKPRNPSRAEKTIAVTDNSGADEAIQKHLGKQDRVLFCRICNFTGTRQAVTRHIETHIEGLSYSCSLCEKTFRSRNSLNNHKSNYHR